MAGQHQFLMTPGPLALSDEVKALMQSNGCCLASISTNTI